MHFLPPVLARSPFQGLAWQFLPPVQKTMLTALSDHSFVQRDTGACSSFCLDASFSHQNLVSSLRLILEQSQENAGKARGSKSKPFNRISWKPFNRIRCKPPEYPGLRDIQVSRMLMGGLANVQIISRLRNMPAVGMRQAYYITR